MSVPTIYAPSLKDVLLSVIADKSLVHVPQPWDVKPASVGLISIMAGASVLPLARMSSNSPLKPLRRS